MTPFELLGVNDNTRYATISMAYGKSYRIPWSLELAYQNYFDEHCLVCYGYTNILLGEAPEQLYFIIKQARSYQAFIFDSKQEILDSDRLRLSSVHNLMIVDEKEFEKMKDKMMLKKIEGDEI
jgi:hypothetical protein